MAEQMRPASNEAAPDPSRSYERAKPEAESGMGRMDNNVSTPTDSPDRQEQTVTNRQDGARQLNGQDDINRRAERTPAPEQPDHSMKDEEPLGWDQAPTDIHDPRQQRHPRTEGKGGTP